MRLAPPPPDVRLPWRPAHAGLLRALAFATAQVAGHERAVSLALSADAPGAIDLPEGAPNAMDAAQLRAAGPLYFAAELEAAGLLRCGELVAGLFASGAITQPLGPVAQSINTFWRGRRDRLQPGEREAIFNRVVEQPHFDRLMMALCRAIVAQADNADDRGVRPDLREQTGLAVAAQSLAEFLAQRIDAMASIAVRDVIDTINAAIGFLRDRMLQSAFGTHSLWALIATASSSDGMTPGSATTVQSHADRGRAGQAVLAWLASNYQSRNVTLDPRAPADADLIMSAQRWLDATPLQPTQATPALTPSLPIAA
ncbi:hypothetical protein DWG18_07565 [Lysobacter sp. TY2-98]|uniref:hypothetical protein n=1 Tax=Lysobacter sp. TY2-98 TaxID=2290922 RepID=UPI000E1FBE92|nr:hypothetical protein [Lysobacter sp. TY2-98]AXK72153.1 hypothetical protein DWG18_07565 [Lysobacter sp. TY2-98]